MSAEPTMLDHRFERSPGRETVLLVHGLGANRSQFEAEHRALAGDFQVLSVSLRGHGRSLPAPRGPWTLAELGAELLGLLDALELTTVHYVGNSMGGNVGLELLRAAPERLRSLTTFGTTAQLHKSTLTLRLLGGLYRALPMPALARLAASAGRSPTAKARIAAMMADTPKATILALLPALARFDYLDTLAASSVPYLLIRGEHDREINAELDATVTCLEKRGNFRLCELAGAGHFANLDRPAAFEDALRSIAGAGASAASA